MSTEASQEHEQTLVTVAGPLLVWAAHFVVSYAVAAVFCAKDLSLVAMRVSVAAATLVALGWVARQARRALALRRAGAEPHGAPTEPARRGFLGRLIALVAGLAAVAIVYSALVFVLVRDCR